MRGRLVAAAAVVVTILGLLPASLPGSADAALAPGDGSARAQAAAVDPGSGLTTSTNISVLGLGLSPLLTPLTNLVINPLVNALVAVPTTLTSSLTDTLVNAGLRADSTDTQQPRPASGYPTCGQQGWNAGNCYGPLLPAVSVPPLLTLTTGATQGYATGDSTGFVAMSRVADPQLNVLGFPLGDLGLIDSSTSCGTTAASCAATQSLSGSSLLGGRLTFSLANGGPYVVKLDGATVPAAGATLSVAGFSANVKANGNLATITVALTLTQLLSALGLPNLLTALGALGTLTDDGTTVALTIKVGPGSVSQTSPASAWGLNVSVDLDVAVKLKLSLLLPIAGISITAGGTSPSLVGLKLGYSTATAGALPPGWVPPTLI